MKTAVVQNSVVVAIVDGKSSVLGGIVPGVSLVAFDEASTTVVLGYTYDSVTFAAPVPVTVMSKRDFLVRFTQEERVAIRSAMVNDLTIQDANSLMELSDNIDVTDPYAMQYVGYLVSQGLLTQARADVILAPVGA